VERFWISLRSSAISFETVSSFFPISRLARAAVMYPKIANA